MDQNSSSKKLNSRFIVLTLIISEEKDRKTTNKVDGKGEFLASQTHFVFKIQLIKPGHC